MACKQTDKWQYCIMVPWVTPIGATNYQVSEEIKDCGARKQNLKIFVISLYLRLGPENSPGNGEPHQD